MFERKIIKGKGKSAFLRNYWKCLLVALLLTLFVSNNGLEIETNNYSSTYETSNYSTWGSLDTYDYVSSSPVQSYSIKINNIPISDIISNQFIISLSVGISIVLSVFVFSILEIGGCSFFLKNIDENASLWNVLSGFEGNTYLKNVWIQFLRSLYVILWSLLLIIPGIIKAYQYYMIPYLLAEYPEMSKKDVFRLSKEMMNGNKWQAFIFELSFIGWHLLNSLTFGLVGLFYSQPYMYASKAELYLAIKESYTNNNDFENKNNDE